MIRIARWVVVGLVVVLVCWLGWTASLSAEFNERVEALRAAGEPVEMSDLSVPAVPDEMNAAPLLRKAHEWYAKQQDDGTIPGVFQVFIELESWEEDDWTEVTEWLAKAHEYIRLLEDASRRSSSRFDLRWEDGVDTRFSSVLIIVAGIGVLDAAARAEAREGRVERAVGLVATMLRLGGLMERQVGITYLVRLTVHMAALDTLESVANRPGFDPTRVRAQLEPYLRNAEDPSRLVEALRGERVMGLWTIRRWIEGESLRRLLLPYTILEHGEKAELETPKWTDVLWSSFLARPFAYRDGLAFLELMDEAMRICAEGSDTAGQRLSRLQEEADARGLPYIFTRLYSWLPANMYREHLRHVATLRVARVALAVQEFRQQNGDWPKSLDEVSVLFDGPVPTDPFSGTLLRYARVANGVRIEADAPIRHESLREDFEIAWIVR